MNDFITINSILADVLLDCDDEATRLRTPGFYSWHLGHGLSKLGYETRKGKDSVIELGVADGRVSIPREVMDIHAVYGYDGEYNSTTATKIYPKDFVEDGKHTDSHHVGDDASSLHFYSLQEGVMLLSSACNFSKIRLTITELTGKEAIPSYLHEVLRTYTTLQFCRSMRIRNPQLVGMARELGNELYRPYTGLWPMAERFMNELTRDQKELMRRHWDRGNY